MSLDHIKTDLFEKWGDGSVTQLCVVIIDFIHELPKPQREMLTYRTFANATGRHSVDVDILTAVNILVSSRCALLDAKALFVDENEEYELEPEDWHAALTDGRLAHPETGDLVEDWKDHIVPFFVPSALFTIAEN